MLKRGVLLLSLFAISVMPALGQSTPTRIRGTIVGLEGSVLTVATAAENRRITLADGFRVYYVVKADLAKLVAGAYVGSAAVTQPDGTLRALEVHIFPEAMRGTGEGHQPYDLGAQSTMTNGTVDAMALVESVAGHVLTVKYKDGEKKIVVSNDTPIVAYEAADAKALIPGAHVYIVAQRGPDGSLSAARVNVGKNGLVPPM